MQSSRIRRGRGEGLESSAGRPRLPSSKVGLRKDSHVELGGKRAADLWTDDPWPGRAGGFYRCRLLAITNQEPPLSRQGSRLAILVYQGSDPTQPYPTLVIRDRAPRFFPRLCALGSDTTLFGPSSGWSPCEVSLP